MRHDKEQWGPRLYQYVQTFWESEGLSAAAWAMRHGIQDANLTRWKAGTEPKISSLLVVADALGISLIDMLVEAGVLSEEETGHQPMRPVAAPIMAAISAAPDLPDSQREQVQEFVAALLRFAAQAAEEERENTRKRPIRRTRK